MSIYASNKALFDMALSKLVEHIDDGNDAGAAAIRITLTEVFNNTIDDNERLLNQLKRLDNCPKCGNPLVCKEGC